MRSDFPDQALLRRALLANAAFSGLSAVVLGLGAAPLAGWLGPFPPSWLRGVAVGLALFAVDLVLQARAPRVHPLRAFGATLGDLAWVAGSVVLLVLRPTWLSHDGRAAVAAVAGVVLVLAVLQLAGLRRYARNQRRETDGASMYRTTARVPAPPNVVWARLRALERIHEYYGALAEVAVTSEGDATVRTCVDRGGRRWSEEVVRLDDETRTLTLRFRAEAPDFPFPMTAMTGGWRVEPHADGSEVLLWYEFTVGGGAAGEVAAALMGPLLEKRMGPVLEAFGRPEPVGAAGTAAGGDAGEAGARG